MTAVGRAVTHPKRSVLDTFTLDLKDLRTLPCSTCEEDAARRWIWWGKGNMVEVSKYLLGEESAELLIETRLYEGELVYKAQWLSMTPTNPRLGGTRWWVVCPDCERRIRVLHRPFGAKRFSCRECHRLTYPCRAKHRDRFWERFLRPLEKSIRYQKDLRSRSRRRRIRACRAIDPDFPERVMQTIEAPGATENDT